MDLVGKNMLHEYTDDDVGLVPTKACGQDIKLPLKTEV